MTKNYEKYYLTIVLTILLLLTEFCLLSFSLQKRIIIYRSLTSTVITHDLIEVVMDDKDLKALYKNKYLYYNNKKYPIKIEKITRNILQRNNNYYHYVILDLKLPKKVKVNDVIKFNLEDYKISLVDMFKTCWKGD